MLKEYTWWWKENELVYTVDIEVMSFLDDEKRLHLKTIPENVAVYNNKDVENEHDYKEGEI